MFSLNSLRRAPVRLAATGGSVALLIALFPAPAQAAGGSFGGDAPAAADSDSNASTAAPSNPAPKVEVEETSVPSVSTDSEPSNGDPIVAELGKTATSNYRLVGVVWSSKDAPDDVAVELRTRTDGTWSEWFDLDVDHDESGEGGNPGTEPLWVGDADGVAARITSDTGTPEDIRITTIDSGPDEKVESGVGSDEVSPARTAQADTAGAASPALYRADVADGTARATATADGTPLYPPRPNIISRGSWGAKSGTYCNSPQIGSTSKGVVIHHTAGSNSYTASQSKSIVRGIQAYHVNGRGWCDIGYNFLVDKYGQIFEGRKGGVDRNVRAAHSGNNAVNTYTMGVSMMGNLDRVAPSSAMKNSMVKLIGWRMGTFYLNAKGTYSLGGKTLNMISGHRNVVSTGCPGTYGYAWLSQSGGLRDRVEAYLSKANTPIKMKAKALGRSFTGDPYVGEYIATGGRKTRFSKLEIYDKAGVGTHYVADISNFRNTYVSFNAQRSPLGFPTTDTPAARSYVTIQRFEHGSMYAVPGKGVFGVWGPTYSMWGTLKGSIGVLGAPLSSVGAEKGGETRTNFEHGYIIANVKLKTATAYDSNGKVIKADSGGSDAPTLGQVPRPRTTATTTSATWTWVGNKDATSYQVCLIPDTRSTRCTAVQTVTGTSATFENLLPTGATDWYGRVRARNAAGYGPWSDNRGVNLVPRVTSRPTATATTTSTSWTWGAVPGAISYKVCLVPDTRSKSCTSTRWVRSPHVSFPDLDPTGGTDWYARVRVKDSRGYGSWSSFGGVNLASRTPKTPSATATADTARWTWPAVEGATSYKVCLVPSTTSKSCTSVRWVRSPGVTFTDLAPTGGTDWYAKVSTKHGRSYSGWSAYRGVNLTGGSTGTSTSTVTVPSSRKVSISGHGYGHGIGMSQYGAEGAARQGQSYSKILAHYYGGTTLGSRTGLIKVLISEDSTDGVLINAQSGLRVRDISAHRTISLPTKIDGKTVLRWHMVRISSSPTRTKLMYKVGSTYYDYRVDGKVVSWSGDAFFHGPSVIDLVLPDNSVLKLRGYVRSAKPSAGTGRRDTVNVLPIEDYVRGVIAAEMPSSWHPEALKAQAVAARTYGVRAIGSHNYYDICSTTACQVYRGYARETANTDAAVKATAGKILEYKGSPAVTQFSSSSGGFTASSAAVKTYPYLKAVTDPYDGWSGNANHSWKTTVTASKIESKYPTIGTLKKMTITKRTGDGDWGGRVTSLVLTGSKKSVTITGNDARWAFGLKSNWFTF